MLSSSLLKLVSYARAIENFGLSFRALETAFQAIQISEISSAAAHAIDKIIRASSLIGSHIPDVAQAVRQLVSSPAYIVDKVRVVEGFTFLISRNIDKEKIPGHCSAIFDVLDTIDIRSCNSDTALETLKIVFAVGKTLYTTSPEKSEAKVWKEGQGRQMAEWVRQTCAIFADRFNQDFEIMEVLKLLI